MVECSFSCSFLLFSAQQAAHLGEGRRHEGRRGPLPFAPQAAGTELHKTPIREASDYAQELWLVFMLCSLAYGLQVFWKGHSTSWRITLTNSPLLGLKTSSWLLQNEHFQYHILTTLYIVYDSSKNFYNSSVRNLPPLMFIMQNCKALGHFLLLV